MQKSYSYPSNLFPSCLHRSSSHLVGAPISTRYATHLHTSHGLIRLFSGPSMALCRRVVTLSPSFMGQDSLVRLWGVPRDSNRLCYGERSLCVVQLFCGMYSLFELLPDLAPLCCITWVVWGDFDPSCGHNLVGFSVCGLDLFTLFSAIMAALESSTFTVPLNVDPANLAAA